MTDIKMQMLDYLLFSIYICGLYYEFEGMFVLNNSFIEYAVTKWNKFYISLFEIDLLIKHIELFNNITSLETPKWIASF